MLPCGGPSGPGRGRGWVGSGLRFQPGVQELLVLLVDSCIYVGMCGSLGRWFIASVSFSKASMPPSLGRTFAERQVKPAAWLTPGGRASGARTAASVPCHQRPATSTSGGPGPGGREASSPHRHGPCCHTSVEVHGQVAGSQDKLFPSHDSQQVQGVSRRERNCLQFWAPPVPSAVPAGHLPR